MNTFGPILTQISDYFNFFTHETEFQEEFKLKGGPQGSEWHTKFLNTEIRILKNKIKRLKAQFYEEPILLDVVGDNALRLSLFAGVERLITVRQAQSLLVDRFGIRNENGSALNSFFNSNFKGYFRGFLVNFANFIAVQYHSLFYARGASLTQHILLASILEGIFHPLDTIRTVLYSDIRGRYKGYGDLANDLISRNGISHLYRGVSWKLGYNFFFIWNLRNMYDDNKSQWFSFPAWMASYALLNVKTKMQICDTRVANQSLENPYALLLRSLNGENIKCAYAGFVPFILLNTFFMWNLKGLYGEKRKKKEIANLEGKLKEIGAKRPLEYFENFL